MVERGLHSNYSSNNSDKNQNNIVSLDSEIDLASGYIKREYGENLLAGGRTYTHHALGVSKILSELGLDTATIIAGLLHDVSRIHVQKINEIKRIFSIDIGYMIEAFNKLSLTNLDDGHFSDNFSDKLYGSTDSESQNFRQLMLVNADNLRKLFVAMAQDARVITIRLAEGLDIVDNVDQLTSSRRLRIASEALYVLAPIAHRLGIWTLKSKLEDAAFRHLNPDEFNNINSFMESSRSDQETTLKEAVSRLDVALKSAGITADITSRQKHLYSIYNKITVMGTPADKLYDVIGLRVIIDDLYLDESSTRRLKTRTAFERNILEKCYTVAGIITSMWSPIPNGIFDYISNPKPNGYQSIHLRVLGPFGTVLEVQVRTRRMHYSAEFGIAAHWQYKEHSEYSQFEMKFASIRERVADAPNGNQAISRLMKELSQEFLTDKVYVFTPAGRLIELPAGSTPIDFAFKIHSDLGIHCYGARVADQFSISHENLQISPDGGYRIVPLSYVLKNGEVVKIVNRPSSTPSADWLGFVRTNSAKAKIRAYLNLAERDEQIRKGISLIEQDLLTLVNKVDSILKGRNMSLLHRLRPPALRNPNGRKIVSAIAPLHGFIDDTSLLSAVGGTQSSLVPTIANEIYLICYGDIRAKFCQLSLEEKRSELNRLSTELLRLKQLNESKNEIATATSKKSVEDLNFHVISDQTSSVNNQYTRLYYRLAKCCRPLPGDEVMGYVSLGNGVAIHRIQCHNAKYYQLTQSDRCRSVKIENPHGKLYQATIEISANDRRGLLADLSHVFKSNHTNIKDVNSVTIRLSVKTTITAEFENRDDLDHIIVKIRDVKGVIDVVRQMV